MPLSLPYLHVLEFEDVQANFEQIAADALAASRSLADIGSTSSALTNLGLRLWRRLGTTSAPTTASAAFTTIPEMSITDTFSGGPVLSWFTGNLETSTNPSNYVDTAILVDGTQPYSNDGTRTAIPTGVTATGSVSWLADRADCFTPAAGTHTITIGWATGGGTATAYTTRRSWFVLQLPSGFPVN